MSLLALAATTANLLTISASLNSPKWLQTGHSMLQQLRGLESGISKQSPFPRLTLDKQLNN